MTDSFDSLSISLDTPDFAAELFQDKNTWVVSARMEKNEGEQCSGILRDQGSN